MDDMIYRNDPIAEENIDPHGRPATDEFEEWSEEVSERTDTGYSSHQSSRKRNQSWQTGRRSWTTENIFAVRRWQKKQTTT